jgi:hypothetical protein
MKWTTSYNSIEFWDRLLFNFYNSFIKDKNESLFSLNEDPSDAFDNNTDNNESSNTQPKLIARRFDESIINHPLSSCFAFRPRNLLFCATYESHKTRKYFSTSSGDLSLFVNLHIF